MDNVLVYNIPSDYPDAALHKLVSDLKTSMVSKKEITAVLNSISALPKRESLSIDKEGSLTVTVKNMPSDFPSSEILEKLIVIQEKVIKNSELEANMLIEALKSNRFLTEIINNTSESSAELKSVISVRLDNIASSSDTLNDTASEIKKIEEDLFTTVSDIKATNNNLLDTVAALPDKNYIKTSDSGVLCDVTNLPEDYPDNATTDELSAIHDTVKEALSEGILLQGPLNEGSNLIGKVDVVSLPLPPDAATASNQTAMLESVNCNCTKILHRIKDSTLMLNHAVDDVRKAIVKEFPYILYKDHITVESSIKTPVLKNSNMGGLRIHVLSKEWDSAQGLIRVMTSDSPGGCQFLPVTEELTVIPGRYQSFDLNGSMPYFYIEINKNSAFSKCRMDITVIVQKL